MKSIDAQDKQWQRESDARTLAEAEEIKSNSSRMKGAKAEASKMAKEQEKKVKTLKKVSKALATSAKKAAPKRSTRGKKK